MSTPGVASRDESESTGIDCTAPSLGGAMRFVTTAEIFFDIVIVVASLSMLTLSRPEEKAQLPWGFPVVFAIQNLVLIGTEYWRQRHQPAAAVETSVFSVIYKAIFCFLWLSTLSVPIDGVPQLISTGTCFDILAVSLATAFVTGIEICCSSSFRNKVQRMFVKND